jgi:hypothetical protein
MLLQKSVISQPPPREWCEAIAFGARRLWPPGCFRNAYAGAIAGFDGKTSLASFLRF